MEFLTWIAVMFFWFHLGQVQVEDTQVQHAQEIAQQK